MNDIKQKALALLRECVGNARWKRPIETINRQSDLLHEALCRAIEHHEAFRQEVHDAVWDYFRPYEVPKVFGPIIIWEPTPEPKPDPLVDIVEWLGGEWTPEEYVKEIRAALDARGLEIREKNDD